MPMGFQVQTSRGLEQVTDIQTLRKVMSTRRVVGGSGSQSYAAGFLNNAFLQVEYESGAEYDFVIDRANNVIRWTPTRSNVVSSTFWLHIIKVA